MPTLTQILFGSLLDNPTAVEIASKAGEKALFLIREHFTYSAYQITSATQQSFSYALGAISIGVAAADNKLGFTQKIFNAKITREFAEQIDHHYLQPFTKEVQRVSVADLADFREQTVKALKHFAKHKDELFQIKEITEEDLAALISYRDTFAISDLVLEQMRRIAPVDDTLAAFLRFDGLLGDAVLFFFRELIRQDERLEKTQAALQREGLCLEVQHLQTALNTAQDNLSQAIAKQSTNLVELAQQLQGLRQTQVAWQTRHEQLIRFSSRFENQLGEMLAWAKEIDATLDEIHEDIKVTQQDVKATKDLAVEIIQLLGGLMAQQNLSSQVKPRDEFTQHNSTSLKLIQKAVSLLKQLSPQNPQYSRVSIMVGSALSSTGALEEAERLFSQAIEKANNNADKALAHFDLFQVQLRRKAYPEALQNLQAAIKSDRQKYALHNINKYPMRQLLGAGGMGCVLLCQNQDLLRNPQHQQVAVKCFWESRQGAPEEVFGEALKMRHIASHYVPEPLDYGYADELKQERAFFVSEYLDGAIDGEAWLEKYGPMDLETGLQVGLQIAQGLKVAHDAGIYHLDLKPANILLKTAKVSGKLEVYVKIIDFGLSQVATSLREAAVRQSQTGLTVFGLAVFGTLDYAPPEQRGYTHYGKPSAKSDIFAFGKTLYRLLTGEIPLEVEPETLEHAPELFNLLYSCTRANPKKRPESAQELVSRLGAIARAIYEQTTAEPDNQAWQTACQLDTPSAYQAYLDGDTLKQYADEAQKRLQALEQAEAERAADKKAWQTARQQHTQSAYQAYLNGNTLKQYTNEAKQQLQALEKAEAERAADKNAWQTARQQNTQSAYQAYLKGSTIKQYADEAKQQLQALEKAEAERVADKTAWQTARQQHTPSAYQAYLKGSTIKQYADEAQKQLQALEKAQAEQAAADKKAWQTKRPVGCTLRRPTKPT
jgi:serine/threonine protein kinase